MISFIIPTLNEEKYLEKLLINLSGYSGEKEIIISDGNSKDKTIEIAKKYTDKVLVYTGKARQNISMGKNWGAETAKGDILLFLDADMNIPNINEFMKFALDKLKDEKVVALGAVLRVEKEQEKFMDMVVFGVVNWLFRFQNNVMGRGAMSGEFQMIKKGIFKKYGGYNEKLPVAEDMEMFYRLSKVGKTKVFTEMVVYHTGRRAHKIGWPKLLYQWITNYFSVFIFGRSKSEEWTVIR